MDDQPLSAGGRDALGFDRRQQVRLVKAQRRQGDADNDDGDRIPAAHPLQFDERGFPVAQPPRGRLAERVRRLLAVPPR